MAMIEDLIYVYKHLKIETSSSRQIMLMHDNELSLTRSICNEKKQNSDCISESLGTVHQQAASTNKSIIHKKTTMATYHCTWCMGSSLHISC